METWLAEGPCPSQKGLQWVTGGPLPASALGRRERIFATVKFGREAGSVWSVKVMAPVLLTLTHRGLDLCVLCSLCDGLNCGVGAADLGPM